MGLVVLTEGVLITIQNPASSKAAAQVLPGLL